MQINQSIQQLEPQNWVCNHKRYLHNVAFKKLPQDLVEDIVQETFLAALKSAHRFKGNSSERVWLTSILKFKIADHYRSASKMKNYPKDNLEAALSSSKNKSSWSEYTYDPIFESINGDDLKLVLNSAMGILSPREQEIIKLKEDGYNTEAICEKLQISRSHCWVLLHRARKKLQQHLSKNW